MPSLRRTALRRPRGRLLISLAIIAATTVVASGLSSGPARASSVAPRTSGYRHIIEVVMENLGYSSATSYSGYRALAHRYASASDSYAASHPSLPNYLDLVGGSTFGVNSDCTGCYKSANNLGAQLSKKHVTWGDFSEGVPGACYLGSSNGLYAGKHNPFRYFTDIRKSKGLCHHLVPLTTLLTDLRHPRSVPRFSFVTPNLCHDGHDCSPTTSFSWLQHFVKSVTASSAWSRHGLLIVTWDEGGGGDNTMVLPTGRTRGNGGGGHIATLFIAPGVPKGTIVHGAVTHESLLASIESNFHLGLLGGASAWSKHTLRLP